MTKFEHIIDGKALWEWRSQAIAQAQAAQVEPAEVDWLLQGLCQIDRLALRLETLSMQSQVASHVTIENLQRLWERRVGDRVPVQHLVGTTPWRDFLLRVSADVLIPRPETELIVDIAADWVAHSAQSDQLRQGTWVDLGTGSGAIALGLATAFPEAKILAVDISPAALRIANENAAAHGLSDRVHFLTGAWFEPLTSWSGQLAGVVSNPPYIPSAVVPTLDPEVVQHEPHLALDGGSDGLQAVAHLIQTAPRFLMKGGLWLVELMQGQAPVVMTRLAQTEKYAAIQAHPDLAQVERFVSARRT